MKYSELKNIRKFCENLTSTPDWRETVDHIVDGDSDFEVGNVRFIADSKIDEIQAAELSSDMYCLGCFNDWFIADILGIDVDVIQAMQKAEAFEAIGKLIMSLGKLEELQESYVSADGYGHHFNHYDGNDEEITVDGRLFHAFDNR